MNKSVSDFASFILDEEGLDVVEQETADTKKLDVIEYDDDDTAEIKPFNAGSPASYKENITEYQKNVERRKKDLPEITEDKKV